MVIPGWRYLVSGGTTGQVFTKVSSADGDYEWSTPSSGGTPGGSDTQIQFNNSGAFGGSANLTWNNTDGQLTMQAVSDGYSFQAKDYNGNRMFALQINGPNPFVAFGDVGLVYNCTYFYLDDGNRWIEFNCPAGAAVFGDFEGLGGGNGTQFKVDDANQKTTSNVKHEGSNASGTYFDSGTGTFQVGDLTPAGASTHFLLNDTTGTIELFANTFLRLRSYGGIVTIGDVDGDGNSTKLIVDDTNSRATFSKKFVVTDSGDYYAYDTGTSTYWKWASVNGVWTGTDTTSGSLP